MVGPNGLEPSTSSVSGRRSNQLSYGPIPTGATSQLKRLDPRIPTTRKAHSATVSRWRSNPLGYEPNGAKSISYRAVIVPQLLIGAQFGSHHAKFARAAIKASKYQEDPVARNAGPLEQAPATNLSTARRE